MLIIMYIFKFIYVLTNFCLHPPQHDKQTQALVNYPPLGFFKFTYKQVTKSFNFRIMAIDREAMKEGGGRSEMEFTDLELPADSIDASVMFHLVMDVLGFVLFMHQQIPSYIELLFSLIVEVMFKEILQDLSLEFDDMNTEYKDLEVAIANSEMKASQRRIQMGRKRQVKHVIRRLEKLMKTVADTQTALQLVFSDIPHVEAVILVLGASPVRPRRVYEFCFSHGKDVSDACDFTKTRVAEAFSKKVRSRCPLCWLVCCRVSGQKLKRVELSADQNRLDRVGLTLT
ncbi:putative mad1/Cdc20-bound-Mad2 binding protein [Helianthus annuus]|nr:putative mad1/Cdc20-bound-Mad2 binding protein [Helianthus annuus]